jgi:hypothetical protein
MTGLVPEGDIMAFEQNTNFATRPPSTTSGQYADRVRSYVVFDLESAVVDDAAHRRYLQMERWVPDHTARTSRRGYKRGDCPLQTPRWPFQTIAALSAMVLTEHEEGNLQVMRFVTWSLAKHSEAEIVSGFLQLLKEAPSGSELASWGAAWSDIPILIGAALRHGLSLPGGWEWMAWQGGGRVPHIDLARVLGGDSKMKPCHFGEYAAAQNIPAKLIVKPADVAKLIAAGQFDLVEQVAEVDVIAEALLLTRWRKLLDPRADRAVVEDRILRAVEDLRPARGYIFALQAHRAAKFKLAIARAVKDQDKGNLWLPDLAA